MKQFNKVSDFFHKNNFKLLLLFYICLNDNLIIFFFKLLSINIIFLFTAGIFIDWYKKNETKHFCAIFFFVSTLLAFYKFAKKLKGRFSDTQLRKYKEKNIYNIENRTLQRILLGETSTRDSNKVFKESSNRLKWWYALCMCMQCMCTHRL